MDPGGYDAYRVERRFSPMEESSWESSKAAVKDLKTPNRYGLREKVLTAEQAERVRGGGWDLPLLQGVVDQFVYHFDVSGTSRQCFKVLHDVRGLSVQFMLDLDGTVYQTLDLKERAWHATTSNSRSIGIEIANIGAYDPDNDEPLEDWYKEETDGTIHIEIPNQLGESGLRKTGFVARPTRRHPILGFIQGRQLLQYDFTPEQYHALIKLTAAVCKILPRIKCDYPRDREGQLITHQLPTNTLTNYQGLLGHYHVQADKVDPGPAFQWDYVVSEARKLLHPGYADPEEPGNARMRELFAATPP
jgi:N-acetylmuramoyl-L-alanine amidase